MSPGRKIAIALLAGLIAVLGLVSVKAAVYLLQDPHPGRMPIPGKSRLIGDLQYDTVGVSFCCANREWVQLRDEKGRVLVPACKDVAVSSSDLVAVAETDELLSPRGRTVFIQSRAPVEIVHVLEGRTCAALEAGHWSRDGRSFLLELRNGGGETTIQVLEFDESGRRPPRTLPLDVPEGRTRQVEDAHATMSAFSLPRAGWAWSPTGRNFALFCPLEAKSGSPESGKMALFRCSADPPRVEEFSVVGKELGMVDWKDEQPTARMAAR